MHKSLISINGPVGPRRAEGREREGESRRYTVREEGSQERRKIGGKRKGTRIKVKAQLRGKGTERERKRGTANRRGRERARESKLVKFGFSLSHPEYTSAPNIHIYIHSHITHTYVYTPVRGSGTRKESQGKDAARFFFFVFCLYFRPRGYLIMHRPR